MNPDEYLKLKYASENELYQFTLWLRKQSGQLSVPIDVIKHQLGSAIRFQEEDDKIRKFTREFSERVAEIRRTTPYSDI